MVAIPSSKRRRNISIACFWDSVAVSASWRLLANAFSNPCLAISVCRPATAWRAFAS
jgi:hypothetical protein